MNNLRYGLTFLVMMCFLLTGTVGTQEFHITGDRPDSVAVFSSARDHVIGHSDGKTDEVAPSPDMYQCFREPVCVRTNTGRLVVLCHAGNRHAWPERSGQDFAVSFSDDGGKTWSRPHVAAEHGNFSMQAHGLVYDAQIDRILCLYSIYRWDYSLIKEGRGVAVSSPIIKAQIDRGEDIHRQYLITSEDGGETWSRPRDITSMMPEKGVHCHFSAGEGRQLSKGEYAGRLILAGGLVRYNYATGAQDKELFCWLSDDHGLTWRPSRKVPTPEGTPLSCEARITELPDGTLLYNGRTDLPEQRSDKMRGRGLSHSRDGGETWAMMIQGIQLLCSSCNGSMITLRDRQGRLTRTIAASLPTPGGRKEGVVYVSFDSGRTWPRRLDLVPGFFAYSALIQIDDKTVGLFYEAAQYRDIHFLQLPTERLSPGSLR